MKLKNLFPLFMDKTPEERLIFTKERQDYKSKTFHLFHLGLEKKKQKKKTTKKAVREIKKDSKEESLLTDLLGKKAMAELKKGTDINKLVK
jgi:hypothetical protein